MRACFSLACSRNTQSYYKFWKMLSSKVQMILNGRICSLDSQMEMLWSTAILRLVVKAEPRSWTLASNPWMLWIQLHGRDATAGISLVQGRHLRVPLLFLSHRWISGFLGFSHEDFLGEDCVSCAADRFPCENCPHWFDFPPSAI